MGDAELGAHVDPGEEGGAPATTCPLGSGGTETGSAPLLARGPVPGRPPGPQGSLPLAFVWDSPSALLPGAITTVHLFLSPVLTSGRVGTAEATACQLGF